MKKKSNNIFIIGYMGSGKTTVGQNLALLTNKNFVDMDQVIEKEQGATVNQIFMKFGEHSFRNHEAELLDKIVDEEYKFDSDSGAIISTGGGIILDEENCKILKEQLVVWLDADIDVMFDRIKDNPNLPNAYLHIDDEIKRRQMFEKQYHQRKELYKKVADIVIDSRGDVDDNSETIAKAIVDKLKGYSK